MKYFFIFVALIFIYLIYENKFYKIEKVKIKSDKIKDKIKFVQITDYHLNSLINLEKLKRDIEKINPDFVFITGDVINRTSTAKEIDKLKKFLKIFNCEVYFITGNHEFENKYFSSFKKVLDEDGIKTFNGNYFEPQIDARIYGFNYKNNFNFLELDDSKFNILLIHDPLNYIYGIFPRFDLTLSGHIHGGQVRLPGVGAIIDHDGEIFPKYSKGYYEEDGLNLYISSGLGSKFLIRTFNPVEIVEFEICGKINE
ncbi:metallophosphoesterase [Peptoniphilus sp.]|jgi:predicted MPP superfamily phosphohydrolase|uniref:metallophosphoesterase n=1 Tax=Peptoniphilus sp. TaxID=1971214 RepID=UPI003D89C03F